MFPKQAELANAVEGIKKNILIINGLIMKVRIKNPVMGVPISFLDKYCPNQFRILGIMSGAKGETFTNGNDNRAKFYLNGKSVYARILIQKIK